MFKQILKSINTLEMPTFFEHHIITVQCTVCKLYTYNSCLEFRQPKKKKGVLVLLFLHCIVHLFVSQ